MTESLWYKKLEIKTLEENEKLYKNDFKFFQVETFLKAAKKADSFSEKCDNCKIHKDTSEEIAENLQSYLKGDFKSRKDYEKRLTAITNHLKKAHQIYPEQYFISLYSLFGVVGGLAFGALVAYLTIPGFIKQTMLFGFVLGLLIGRILGKRKEKINKINKKIL